jgi:hypothetical protein
MNDKPSVPITLDQIYRAVVEIKVISDSMDARLRALNGTVHRLDVELAVLKDWRKSQANHAIREIPDIKMELARMGAFGGGFGLVTVVVLGVLKAAGLI